MDKVNSIDYISLILVVIGALNWGLVGLIGLNIIDFLFGAGSVVARLIYIVVGLAGLYTLYTIWKLSNREANV